MVCEEVGSGATRDLAQLVVNTWTIQIIGDGITRAVEVANQPGERVLTIKSAAISSGKIPAE